MKIFKICIDHTHYIYMAKIHRVIPCQADKGHYLTFRILIKFYQLLQIPYEQGSAKFQLQIINGWCPSNTGVEVTFCRCGVVHDKQQSFKLFSGITGQATIIKFRVPTNPCELNAKRILPLLKICHDFYYAQSSTKISA